MEPETYRDASLSKLNPDNREPEQFESDENRILTLETRLEEADRRSTFLLNRLRKISGIVDMHTLTGKLTENEWRELKETLKPYSL